MVKRIVPPQYEHLRLADELRAAASLLSSGTPESHAAAVAERLLRLGDTLQALSISADNRWRDIQDGSANDRRSAFDRTQRIASSMHRSLQLRHAAEHLRDFAQALRQKVTISGWKAMYGDLDPAVAMPPTIVTTLLSLADHEVEWARPRHHPLSGAGRVRPITPMRAGMPRSPGYWGRDLVHSLSAERCASPPAKQASFHLRRRLSEAGEELERTARATIMAPLAILDGPFEHGQRGRREAGVASQRIGVCGSTSFSQLSSVPPPLSSGWLWRGAQDSSSDSEDDWELEAEWQREERAWLARQALRSAHARTAGAQKVASVCGASARQIRRRRTSV